MRQAIIIIICVLPLITACKTVMEKKCDDRLVSENFLLRKKLIMIERKNNILEEENHSFTKTIKEQYANIEKLSSDNRSLREKYKNDIALWTKKYQNIQEKNQILKKQSSEKIIELTQLNEQLEKNLGNQIKTLTEDIRNKEKSFHETLEVTKKEAAQKEFALSQDIEKHKKDILKLQDDALSIEKKLKLAQDESDKKDAIISQLQNAIIKHEASIKELHTQIDELKKQPGNSTGDKNKK